ncbi:hypothetical protein PSTG_00094 [Puccinia striiformis f. sp. tritici PST-78]|uniref:Uncharacterized protein n=1 Tax=Puccinia striiformis f. sp. tritici PST-78 TaxID=1165861 RepID=A0A0L0W5H4_9BASI|nr:hypothetical protein PSTG_00094 [Puccinia striiformis f. sp. tritici PST-78]
MHMARSAWKSVTQQTISNCWKHTGIIPGPKDPIVEKQLAKSKSIAADKDLEDIVEKTKQSLDKPLSPSPFFSPTFASSSPLHPSLAFMHPSNVHPALGSESTQFHHPAFPHRFHSQPINQRLESTELHHPVFPHSFHICGNGESFLNRSLPMASNGVLRSGAPHFFPHLAGGHSIPPTTRSLKHNIRPPHNSSTPATGLMGIKYSASDNETLVCQLCKSLHRQHSSSVTEVINFDLMAAFLMQETDSDLHIRDIVQILLHQFKSSLLQP